MAEARRAAGREVRDSSRAREGAGRGHDHQRAERAGLFGSGIHGENEWYTPAKNIEVAREVLGEIDLDPASHAIAQQTVKATRFFTAADDGLKQLWHGRVLFNPPYGRGLIAPFVDKLSRNSERGVSSRQFC